MPPLLFLDVMNPASLRPASRASEPTAPGEADMKLELLLLGIELRP
jgi:hypothetical protein